MIEANSLTKRYGDRAAVQDVSFSCAPGTVTGFLGPNGAGKSTTLKMLCGLAHPTSGTSTLLGLPFTQIPNPGRHVGVLIDASAAHSGRRGRETLGDLRGAARRERLARRRDARARRPGQVGRAQARRPVLARHAPAAGNRARAARRSRGADPRRAGQRPRPRGHALDARTAARLRRPRRHRAALLPPAARGRGDRRPAGDHRRRQDRRRGHPRRTGRETSARPGCAPPTITPCAAPCAASRSMSRSPTTARCWPRRAPSRSATSPCRPGVALRELGSSRDGGLERLFFELTQAAATDLPPSTDHGASVSQMDASPSTLQETVR